MTVNARDTSYLLSGLDEFTTYDVFIYASTRVGSGPSASLTVTTNPSCKIIYVCGIGQFLLSSCGYTIVLTTTNASCKVKVYASIMVQINI